jgi:hypothetical protein
MVGPVDGAQFAVLVGDDEELADRRLQAIDLEAQRFSHDVPS